MSRIYDNKPLLNLPLINVELGQWNQEAMTGYDYVSQISVLSNSRHNFIISGCELLDMIYLKIVYTYKYIDTRSADVILYYHKHFQ